MTEQQMRERVERMAVGTEYGMFVQGGGRGGAGAVRVGVTGSEMDRYIADLEALGFEIEFRTPTSARLIWQEAA
jgi:hypothetical protein